MGGFTRPRRFTHLMVLVTALCAYAGASDLKVNCNGKGKLSTINSALKLLNPQGPNTLTVSGACHENVVIQSFDRLSLIANPGASITDASNGMLATLDVDDSNRFALNGFTINGSVNCHDNSVCRLSGNIIQNSQAGFGLRAGTSRIFSQGDTIINNPSGTGVIVTNQSLVTLIDDTISNNGGHGIQVFSASFVFIGASASTTTISNNGGHGIFATDNGTVRLQVANVTGNAFDGVRVQNGSVLRTDSVAPIVNNVTGNGGAGVNLGDLSHASFANDGSTQITGNLGGIDVYCAGQFAATRNVAIIGGTTNCVEPNPN